MKFERNKSSDRHSDSVFVAAILGDGYRPVEAICPSPLNFSKTILFLIILFLKLFSSFSLFWVFLRSVCLRTRFVDNEGSWALQKEFALSQKFWNEVY